MFVASLALELVRSFSNLYLPNTWQLVLGIFLLGVILFLPRGIGSLIGSPIIGILGSRIDNRKLLCAGFLGFAVCALIFGTVYLFGLIPKGFLPSE